MKITISNLGPIREKAEIDLKPLTVLIGPNNSGKSWLAYALGGILGNPGFAAYMNAYVKEEVQERYTNLENAIKQLLDEGNTAIDLLQFVEDNGELYFNNVARFAKTWMQGFMGTGKVNFENLELYLNLTEIKELLSKRVLSISLESKLSVGSGKHKPLLTALKEADKREIYIYSSIESVMLDEEKMPLKLPEHAIREFVFNGIFRSIHQALYTYIQFFPTERAFFATFPPTKMERLITKNEMAQELSRVEQKAKALPWFIGHFVETLQTLFESSLEDRKQEAINVHAIDNYIRLAQILEQQVLNGVVDFSTVDPDPRREILFTTAGEVLDMPAASSMVRELAPLVLYLRYGADPGELLIIDEPEMNLHPEAQVKLIELLAMLVNAGLHVLITTHSPYIVDHLANLIAADKCADRDVASSQFFLKDSSAFIPQEKVAAYKVEQGKIENILDEDGILNWGTFGNVSNRIIEIYGNL